MSYNFLKEKSKARDVHINTNKHVGGETCRTPGPARQARSRLSAPAPGGSGGPGGAGAGASNGTLWTVWLRGAPEDGCLGQLTPRDRGQGAGAELPFVSSPICVPGAADTAALCGLQCFLSFEAKLGQE